MNFISTSKFQRNSPTDYENRLKSKDTWWIVTSESSSSKVYMCHIHIKLLTQGANRGLNCGRIDCECPSFIYCKYTPRHCKHTVELARQYFGEKSFQYEVLVKSQQDRIHNEDEWCAENYKVFEAMLSKTTKKKKYNTHAEKILLEQRDRLRCIQK